MKTGYSFGSLASFVEALNAAAVKITGDQTIAGIKTFSSNPITSAAQGSGGGYLTRKDYVDGALALKAPLASPVLTGVPTAPTPVQFDATTKLATMAALQRALGNYRGHVEISSSRALTVDDLGKYIYVNGSSAVTLTLPPIATLPSGATFHIQCSSTCPSVSLVSQGENFSGPSGYISAPTTLLVQNATGLSLTCSSSTWFAHNGSGQAYLDGYAGYLKFPQGLIIQWGMGVTSSTVGAVATITLPIAMPSSILSVTATMRTTSTSPQLIWNDTANSRTKATFGVQSNTPTTGFDYFVIGH